MSHVHFASLWSEIEHREDLDSILYEQLAKSRLVDLKPRIEFLVVTKFVLDYQRRAIRTVSERSPLASSVSTEVLEQLFRRILELAQGRYKLFDLCRQTFVSALRVTYLLKDLTTWTCSQANLDSICSSINQWPPRLPVDIDIHFIKPLVGLVDSKLRSLGVNGNTFFHDYCAVHQNGPLSRQPAWPVSESNLRGHVAELAHCVKNTCPYRINSLWELLEVNLMILVDSLKSIPCHMATSQSICHHHGHQTRLSPLATSSSSCQTWQIVQQCFSDPTNSSLQQWRDWMMFLQDMPVCNGQPCAGSCFPAPATQIRYPGSSDAIYLAGKSLRFRNIQQLKSSKLCSTILGKSRDRTKGWMNRAASSAMGAFDLTFDTASLAFQPTSPHGSEVYILGCAKLHPISFQYLELLINSRGPMYLDGLEDLQSGAHTFEIKHNCPFCSTGVRRGAPQLFVRKVEPLGEMMKDLQKLSVITEPETPRTPVLLHPIVTNIAPSPPSPQETRSARSSGNFEYLESPTRTPNPGSRSPTLSDAHSRTSSGASRFRRGIFGHTTSITNHREACHTVLSSDARSIMAWTSGMACCFHISIEQWSPIALVNDISLAAAGPTYFALACLTNGGTAVSLYDIGSAALIGSETLLAEHPRKVLNMKISQDGQLAVTTDQNIILVKVLQKPGVGGWAKHKIEFPLPTPSDTSVNYKLALKPSQVLSFSPDGERLSVATRYSTGKVICGVFPTWAKKSGEFKAVKHSSTDIPVGVADDRGLSAIICSRYGPKTEILLCASTNRNPSPTVHGWSSGSTDVVRHPYNHDIASSYWLPGGRIQCGAAIPGNSPGYVVLSEDSKLYLIQGWGYARQMVRIATDIDFPSPNFDSNYRRLQMTVTSSEVILFWLRNFEGHVVRCNIHGQRNSTKTSVDFSRLFND